MLKFQAPLGVQLARSLLASWCWCFYCSTSLFGWGRHWSSSSVKLPEVCVCVLQHKALKWWGSSCETTARLLNTSRRPESVLYFTRNLNIISFKLRSVLAVRIESFPTWQISAVCGVFAVIIKALLKERFYSLDLFLQSAIRARYKSCDVILFRCIPLSWVWDYVGNLNI